MNELPGADNWGETKGEPSEDQGETRESQERAGGGGQGEGGG